MARPADGEALENIISARLCVETFLFLFRAIWHPLNWPSSLVGASVTGGAATHVVEIVPGLALLAVISWQVLRQRVILVVKRIYGVSFLLLGGVALFINSRPEPRRLG